MTSSSPKKASFVTLQRLLVKDFAMYVILTNKPGFYRTELCDGLESIEQYDYLFCGRQRARYVIALLTKPLKVKIVDEAGPEIVNFVSSKFLEKFETLELARAQLEHLASFGSVNIELRKVNL